MTKTKIMLPVPQGWSRGVALLALASSFVAGRAPAAVWTYTNRTSTVWTNASSWITNGAYGAPPIGVTNFPGRININAAVVYDYATNTGFGTVVNAAPEYGRGMLVASGSSVTGQVDVVKGTLVFFQAALQDAVVVCAPVNGSGTSKGYLNMNGGNLLVIATNYGVLSCPFRGSSSTLGVVTINSGSTVTVDRFRFGGQGGANAVDVAAGCSGNLFLNAGGTLAVRNMANILNPTNLRATNFFNGGTLRVKGAEEGGFPLIGSNIVNEVMGGGLVVDTAGFNARMVSPLLNGTGGSDGGLTKVGSGTLNLRAVGSSYTGPTVVSAGTLGVQVPMASTDLRVQSGATLNFITDNFAPWALPFLGLTNVSIGFDYGAFSGYVDPVIAVNNLHLEGTVAINLLGTSLPITNLTLLTYASKTGSGSFTLGTLPTGAAATLEDTGSALILHITSASLQSLVWSGGDGLWRVNGGLNWNNGTAVYLEYPGGSGDIVTFDDLGGGGTVTIPSVVRPTSITVDDTFTFYTFSGAGTIGGATGLEKLGTSTLQIGTSNEFTGEVLVRGGTLNVDHPRALGLTNGGTVVEAGATLAIGSPFGDSITVAGETATISGNGVGGVLGALRGAATSSGTNVWAGPVEIAASGTRLGTEDNGTLTVAGPIKELILGVNVVLRPGAGGTLTLSSSSNNWAGNTEVFGGVSGKVVLGADYTLPAAGALLIGDATVDLAGHSQAVAGLGQNGGTAANAVLVNNGAAPATLFLDPAINRTFPGIIQDGTAAIAIVKNGTNTQAFTGSATYSGPTTVNEGTLSVALPMSSSSLTLAEGSTLAVSVNDSSWTVSNLRATNATLNLSYGTLSAAPTTPLTTTTLSVSGSNVVNIAGANFPIGPVTLIAYGSKQGDGSFHAGTLPLGMSATIADTGSAIVLNVTVAPRTLTWSGATTGTWNTNGTLDWNFGMTAYQEYANGLGDFVVFDDNAFVFDVNVSTRVRPYAITVTGSGLYSFSGAGTISGPTSLTKSGSGSLTLGSANEFDGTASVTGGFLLVNHPQALGSVVGVTVVTNAATLKLGTDGGTGVTVSSETAVLSGTGVGGARGALRGAAVASGTNTWAGPVVIAADVTRIGTEDYGNLVVSGTISDQGSNYVVLFRPGAGGELTISGLGNHYGHTRTYSGPSPEGRVKLGVNDGFSTNDLQVGLGIVDLNGYSQKLTGISDLSGPGTILNDGPVASTLYVGEGATANFGTFSVIADGASKINLVKEGAQIQSLGGTNSYTGATTVNGGTLRINGGLGNTAVEVSNGGRLDGVGIVAGPVNVQAGGTLQPGVSAALEEVFTIGNAVSLRGTVVFQIGKSGVTPANDRLAGVTDITYGGTLIATNADNSALAAGEVFQLVSASGARNGNFASVQVLPASLGLGGTFNPATGELTLTPAPTTPTLGFKVSGSAIEFSWTGSFKLQAQTNSVSVGLSNNWADYPGGASSPVTVPLDSGMGSVFFRLATP